MEGFFSEVKLVREMIERIETSMGDVETRHEELMLAYKKDTTEKANLELEKAMNTITTLATKVRNRLKSMEVENRKEKERAKAQGAAFESADLRIRESQHSTLLRKYVMVMRRYNELQQDNKSKFRDNIRRQCQIVKPDITEEEVENVVKTGGVDIFKGKRLEAAEKALADIRERHNDIKRLERSLLELHNMFTDMSILVSEQGEMIDRIEYSVQKSGNYVESARKKVKRAEELQRAARQKKICCLISLLVLVIILVVIVLNVSQSAAGN